MQGKQQSQGLAKTNCSRTRTWHPLSSRQQDGKDVSSLRIRGEPRQLAAPLHLPRSPSHYTHSSAQPQRCSSTAVQDLDASTTYILPAWRSRNVCHCLADAVVHNPRVGFRHGSGSRKDHRRKSRPRGWWSCRLAGSRRCRCWPISGRLGRRLGGRLGGSWRLTCHEAYAQG
jgi:hypothetical protein